MASFRTHISFGIALGILSIFAIISAAIAKDPGFVIAIFVAATLGSILPDMDSDSSIPFYVTFTSLSIAAAVLVFLAIYKNTPGNWISIIAWTAGTLLLVWGAAAPLFKKFTRHRGMAHSLPSALLVALATFFLASHFYFNDAQAFMLGLAIMAGFILHLALDEIYAALNFHGTLFIPNKAFGSALKLKSDNNLINLLVFGAIIFLAAGNVQRLWKLAESFWVNMRG